MNMKYLKSFLESNSEQQLEVDSEDVEIIKGLFTDIEDEFDLYESSEPHLEKNTFHIRIIYFAFEEYNRISVRKEIRVELRLEYNVNKENLQKRWKEFLENAYSYGYKIGSKYDSTEHYLGCNLIYNQ